jgi:hypothetical protein
MLITHPIDKFCEKESGTRFPLVGMFNYNRMTDSHKERKYDQCRVVRI